MNIFPFSSNISFKEASNLKFPKNSKTKRIETFYIKVIVTHETVLISTYIFKKKLFIQSDCHVSVVVNIIRTHIYNTPIDTKLTNLVFCFTICHSYKRLP